MLDALVRSVGLSKRLWVAVVNDSFQKELLAVRKQADQDSPPDSPQTALEPIRVYSITSSSVDYGYSSRLSYIRPPEIRPPTV